MATENRVFPSPTSPANTYKSYEWLNIEFGNEVRISRNTDHDLVSTFPQHKNLREQIIQVSHIFA